MCLGWPTQVLPPQLKSRPISPFAALFSNFPVETVRWLLQESPVVAFSVFLQKMFRSTVTDISWCVSSSFFLLLWSFLPLLACFLMLRFGFLLILFSFCLLYCSLFFSVLPLNAFCKIEARTISMSSFTKRHMNMFITKYMNKLKSVLRPSKKYIA